MTTDLLRLLHPRNWLAWAGFGFLWLLTRLPYRMQMRIGSSLGTMVYHCSKKLRQVTEINIKLCFPQLSPSEQQALVKKNFISLGLGLMETAMAWWLPQSALKCEINVQGMEYMEEALQQGHGVILLGPHFSCLEMIGRVLGSRYQFAVMYRPHKKQVISYMQNRFRQKYNIEQIPRHNVRGLIRALNDNKAIWYAYDVDGGEKRSVFANFFGIPTASLTAVSRLVTLSNAIIVPITFYRLDDRWGYDIILSPPIKNFPSSDFVHDAQRLNDSLQEAITLKPEQYIWQYKRFKTRPKDSERFY